MTKTLTEQWKDMDLADEHLYYWRMPNGEVRIMNKLGVCSYKLCYDGGKIDILAPVPSYDEYCNLVFQANKPKNPLSDVMMCYDTEREKKVVERLQEQLNDANELLKTAGYGSKENIYPLPYVCPEECRNYLKKWGVK